jgi:hypothetical protein
VHGFKRRGLVARYAAKSSTAAVISPSIADDSTFTLPLSMVVVAAAVSATYRTRCAMAGTYFINVTIQ